MTTNYDPIAEQYQRSKQQPWRTAIEAYGLMRLVGDPTGKAALDVACGEGFYTRMLRRHGAAKVVGIDLSPAMVELAREQEARHGLGIEYRVGDARALALREQGAQFDLVVAAYLLNYARDRAELRAMCAGIAACLKPGGRFVTVNCNPALDFTAAPSYRQYGFETWPVGAWGEGTPITWTFFIDGTTFEIENYHLNVGVHEEALQSAGFREVRWHEPRVSPEALAAHEPDFWSAFVAQPPVAFIECIK